MAFTLWLSAEEERILEKIMRVEGTRNKEQAVIKAIRDKGASLATLPALDGDAIPAAAAVPGSADVTSTTLVVDTPALTSLDTRVAAG